MAKTNLEKQIQGTLEKSRVKKPARKQKAIAFEPPQKFTQEQKDVWNNINRFLSFNGALTYEILGLIEDYCILFREAKLCKNKFVGGKAVVEYTNAKNHTNVVQSPWLKSYLDIRKEMASIEKQLGIGILNSEKINWKPETVEDEFDRI